MDITNLKLSRLYAKAIFKIAKQKNRLMFYQKILNTILLIVLELKKSNILDNHKIQLEKKLALLISIIDSVPEIIKNLLHLLLIKKKIFLLPCITDMYKNMIFEHYQILEVKIITPSPLSLDQKKQLITLLKNFYKKDIVLKIKIDLNLFGGFIISILDNKMDYSINKIMKQLKDKLLNFEVTC